MVYNETTHLNEVRVAFVLAINCPTWPNKHSEELKGLKIKDTPLEVYSHKTQMHVGHRQL